MYDIYSYLKSICLDHNKLLAVTNSLLTISTPILIKNIAINQTRAIDTEYIIAFLFTYICITCYVS